MAASAGSSLMQCAYVANHVERESGAAVRRTFDADAAAVRFRDRLHLNQSEPPAHLAAALRGGRAPIRLKQQEPVAFGDRVSEIVHRDLNSSVRVYRANRHPGALG